MGRRSGRGRRGKGSFVVWKIFLLERRRKKQKQPLEMGAHKKQAENAHVKPSCLLTTAFAKIVWYSRVPPPCASTAPRVLLPLPTSRGCASWDSSRRNRGPFILQERARRILFAQVFANCRLSQKGFPGSVFGVRPSEYQEPTTPKKTKMKHHRSH